MADTHKNLHFKINSIYSPNWLFHKIGMLQEISCRFLKCIYFPLLDFWIMKYDANSAQSAIPYNSSESFMIILLSFYHAYNLLSQ